MIEVGVSVFLYRTGVCKMLYHQSYSTVFCVYTNIVELPVSVCRLVIVVVMIIVVIHKQDTTPCACWLEVPGSP